jgi:hypothetical protein
MRLAFSANRSRISREQAKVHRFQFYQLRFERFVQEILDLND